MAISVNQTCNALPTGGVELQKVLATVLADLTALRAAHLALTAKLDLDGGVTGTDYASLTDPAALQTVA